MRPPAPNQVSPFADAGDLAFVGLDMRAPSLVTAGFVSSAKNMRVIDGVYETRRGLFSPAWTRYASDDFPYRATYLRDDDAAYLAAYATTYGAGVFADPGLEGDTWIVRVCATALVFTRETEIGRIVAFAPGLSVSGPVQVIQNFNQLVLVRGDDDTSLVWSGSWVDAVQELVPSSVPGGYAAVPNAHYGLAYRERLVLLSGRDDLALGRIGDNTLYGNGTSSDLIYVNRGRGDRLRSAAPLGGQSLLILKSQSAHVLTYALADASDARLDEVPVAMQFDSPHTTVVADGRVWWLDRRGVRTAQLASINADNKVTVEIRVVSDLIAPLIRRINWQYASLFRAAVTEERIYFAVALDDQTLPQTLLVWNRLNNGNWESFDQWDTSALSDFGVLDFAPGMPWLNSPRLFAIGSDGRQACLEYGLGEDSVGFSGAYPVRAAIGATLVSRGYTAGTNDPKKFQRAQFQLDTWNPTLALSTVFDGPGETLDLGAVARDRTKYFNRLPDFDPTNVNGDFLVPHRQDYSVLLNNTGTTSGYATYTTPELSYSYAVNYLVFLPANGHNYRALQAHASHPDTAPDLAPNLWRRVQSNNSISASWATNSNSVAYVAGQSVSYYGQTYECIVTHYPFPGNDPLYHPEYWQDLGVDAAVEALYLNQPTVTTLSAYHSADVNRDGFITASDLNRVIELYNYRVNNARTGDYHQDATAYSGYAPGPGSITTYHSADTSQNGRFSLFELTRVIELYNYSVGGVRTGQYHVQSGTEDGFATGPASNTATADTGIRLEDFQQSVDRREIKREAAWCQLALTLTAGAFKVRSLALEVHPGSTANLTHA